MKLNPTIFYFFSRTPGLDGGPGFTRELLGKALCGFHALEDGVNVWQGVVCCRDGNGEEVLVDLPKSI